jgi:hypothetical protein
MPGSFGPDITTFGGELPSFSGAVQIQDVPVNANVRVSITGDTDHFAIRDVFLMELVERFVGGGDPDVHGGGHRHKEKVLEVVGKSDGSSPVQVKRGQLFLVRAKYAAGQAEGSFFGTLVIDGDTWETVSVPLSLFLELVTATASDTLTIAQGHRATLGVVVTSIMGPAVDVRFEMSPTQLHTGLTLLDNVVRLGPKQTKTQTLEFHADRDAPLGANQVAIRKFPRPGFFISVNIVSPRITVNAAGPNRIRALKRGVRIDIPVVISLNGGAAATISFSAEHLPSGVAMQAAGVFAQTETTTTTLRVFLGDQAPDLFSFSIQWFAFSGSSGELVFNIEVAGDVASFSLDAPLSALSHENDPKPMVCDMAMLTCRPDGRWNFQAHLDNQETQADLSFLLEVRLDFADSAGRQFGDTIDGALSAAGDGPATKSGLRILGYPSGGTFLRHGVFDPFKESAYFQSVKATAARFRLLVATQEPDSPNIPDPPDTPDKKPGEGFPGQQ